MGDLNSHRGIHPDDRSRPVICFGESLWDSLPAGLFPGGAPMNVAYHLARLRRRVLPVTAVGGDVLGTELLARLDAWGLDTRYVNVLDEWPTGRVTARLDALGNAHYEILTDVAWDGITVDDAVCDGCRDAAAIVHGTLALRQSHNRDALHRLLDCVPTAVRAFDVNLRAPHDDLDEALTFAVGADLVKLNDEELRRLTGMDDDDAQLERGAKMLTRRTGCGAVCVTAGALGAGLLLDGQWHWSPARPVNVRDTVGAGDAFMAALLDGWLERDLPPDELLTRCCRLGEFVAACDGATPHYDVADGP